MVLQFLLPLLTGGGALGNRGSALGGLMQGGGFGLGYGFMVRAGYDLYGAIKDKLVGSLMGARYTVPAASSMIGTGGLMGLNHNPANRVDNTTLNSMVSMESDPRYKKLQRLVGPSNAKNAYIQSGYSPSNANGSTNQGSQSLRYGNRTFSKQISPLTGRLETDYQFQNRVSKTLSRQRNRYSGLSQSFLSMMQRV